MTKQKNKQIITAALIIIISASIFGAYLICQHQTNNNVTYQTDPSKQDYLTFVTTNLEGYQLHIALEPKNGESTAAFVDVIEIPETVDVSNVVTVSSQQLYNEESTVQVAIVKDGAVQYIKELTITFDPSAALRAHHNTYSDTFFIMYDYPIG